MKRLSQKKEERKRRSIINENEEYEYSEASSNIDRDGLTQYSSPNKHDNTYISAKVANNSTMAQSEPINFYASQEQMEEENVYDTQEENANQVQEEEQEEDEDEGPYSDQFDVDEQQIESGSINNIGNPNMNPAIRKRRSLVEQTHDLRVLLNRIFAMRGGWKVKNLAEDFSCGFLFQELFNILYDEKINCCLEGNKEGPNPRIPLENKIGNWNKINAGICFNYFQQQFYLVQGSMTTLAKGKNNELTAQAIRELLIAMQGTHHTTFDDAVDVRDIADLLRINI